MPHDQPPLNNVNKNIFRKMRIGIILDSLHPGGSEVLTVKLAEAFVKQDHFVFIIALRTAGPIAQTLKDLSIPYVTLNLGKGIQPLAMYTISKLIKKNKCNILLTNHFRPLVHCWLASQVNSCQLVHIEHDNLQYRSTSKYLRLLDILLHRVSKFVVISTTLSDYFSAALPRHKDKIETIVNGVDCSAIIDKKKARQQFLLDHPEQAGHVVFGTCARLEPVKNIALMLDIFHDYWSQNPESCLLIVGDGSCKDDLIQQAKDLGIFKSIIFAGYQREVTAWLQAMDCYLITSDDEGLPLSVLEAMSCALPVIARDVGDLPRIIDKTCGRLVVGTTISDWSVAVKQIVTNIQSGGDRSIPDLGENAKKIVQDLYSLDSCVASYLKLFQKIS